LRCWVKKPVPHATSSVRAGGRRATSSTSSPTSPAPARPVPLGEQPYAFVPLVVLSGALLVVAGGCRVAVGLTRFAGHPDYAA
jgi:hypothetical protein